jgi:hypothetical protein
MTLEQRYQRLCETPSSINELLPVLRRYAEQCDTVAELGVDIGQSTTSFLMAQPRQLTSVDVVMQPELDELWKLTGATSFVTGDRVCNIGSTMWLYLLKSSLNVDLSLVDLLLIDSSHHYAHIKAELERHHSQVRRWIMCHDTVAYGEVGEAGLVGILPAIREFLQDHPSEWRILEDLTYNNGLMILERCDAY